MNSLSNLLFIVFLATAFGLTLPNRYQAIATIQIRDNPSFKYTVNVSIKNYKVRAECKIRDETYFYSEGQMIKKNQTDVECVDVSSVPPMNLLKSLLENAKNMTNDKTFDVEVNKCKGDKYVTYYEGDAYVICAWKDRLFRIVGPNVLISLKPDYEKHEIRIPGDISKCIKSTSVVEPLKLDETAWFEKSESCGLSWMHDKTTCVGLKKEGPTKVCIFFHGSGERVTGPTIPEHTVYWGDLHKHTPQCKERRFVRQETKYRGWDSEEIQKIYCQESTFDQEDKTVIRNKIIFSHSMGAMVLAGAIRNKYCEIDLTTSSWYSVASPFEGSHIVPFIKGVCERKVPGLRPEIYRWVTDFFGYCYPGKDQLYPVYESLGLNYSYMPEIAQIAIRRIKGSLCGTSAFGLNTMYSIPLSVVASFAGHPNHNDGLVDETSCKLIGRSQGRTYKTDPGDLFYKPATNHPDNTCRNGNGAWGNNRRPCSFFTNKV